MQRRCSLGFAAIAFILAAVAAGCSPHPGSSSSDAGDAGPDGGDDAGDGGMDAGFDAGHPVAFCDGVDDDPLSATVAASLQKCIDAAPDGGAAEIAPLVYSLGAQLLIARPITFRTAGTATDPRTCLAPGSVCAQLVATPDFDADGGLVALLATSGAVIDHLAIDGNRAARLGSAAAQACINGDARRGENASSNGCSNCTFSYSASVNALCGSGLDWTGDSAVINDALFSNNGDADGGFGADGLTLRQSDGASVLDNIFVDSSGTALVAGGTRSGSISQNRIRQVTQPVTAGLWIHAADGAGSGDFTGTLFSANSIDCGAQLCDFGIAIGSHAWDSTAANTLGATVTSSTVAGAKLGILAEGAGTSAAPLNIYFNIVSRSVASASFACGTRATVPIDLSPDSVFSTASDVAPYDSVVWHDCK